MDIIRSCQIKVVPLGCGRVGSILSKHNLYSVQF